MVASNKFTFPGPLARLRTATWHPSTSHTFTIVAAPHRQHRRATSFGFVADELTRSPGLSPKAYLSAVVTQTGASTLREHENSNAAAMKMPDDLAAACEGKDLKAEVAAGACVTRWFPAQNNNGFDEIT